jgi:carbamoyltransferase
MLVWGISALSHDASLAVIDGDRVVFAAHAERYSRVKNDARLHPDLVAEALRFGRPDAIAWYERPYLKKVRHVRAGQWGHALATSDLPRAYLKSLNLPFPVRKLSFYGHHESHAMAGIATSGFADAAVIVADAIGEFDTFTIWRYTSRDGLQPLYRRRYPHSLGLLYSAFTRRCGFRPNEDEYIIMGMAGFGEPKYVEHIEREWIDIAEPGFRLRRNVHRGIGDWLPDADVVDLAASIQAVAEKVLLGAAGWARRAAGSGNLVLMGGVALNCMANARIAAERNFDQIWIFPNPGDAGSSVGAAAAHLRGPLVWPGPYLGTPIDRALDPGEVVRTLRAKGVLALANGRAEFGPRALGNRSILADPRSLDMKDRVNQIKGREKFRPFAPVVRQEVAHKYFEMPVPATPYMQFTARCLEPERFPAVVHVDGTSRVQTVTVEQHPVLCDILQRWEDETGCPMLLNTSLNSRGEPLVNTWQQATAFGSREDISVL